MRVAVVLSGCGVYDGSEIHEAVLTLLALDREGVEIECVAPDMDQLHVINHETGKSMENEYRNVPVEAARIARGKVTPLHHVTGDDFDAAVFPGGYGAVKNLCSYAMEGTRCLVNPDVEMFVQDLHRGQKPIGFICVTPIIAARVLGQFSPKLTIGNDQETSEDIQAFGGEHFICKTDDIVIDEINRLVSTPAYMLETSIASVAIGIEKCVKAVLKLASHKE